MTTTLEFVQPHLEVPNGDTALKIVDRYRGTVEDHFRVDPLEVEFPTLSQKMGHAGLYFAEAADNLALAFKWRGAIVGATKLQEQGHESLLVPSAGNHARGAILAAKALGMTIHVVIPKTAPPAKKEGLRELWGDSSKLHIHAVGESFDDALDWTSENERLGALLHPYDNPWVIAGQGTIVDDTLAALEHPDELRHYVVSTGGFGGPAGALQRFQELGRTDVTVHAVEAAGSNSLSKSMEGNQLVEADSPNARFGGSQVKKIGRYGFAIWRRAENNLSVVSVSDSQVDTVTSEYEADRKELLRLDTPHFEPTTLQAITAVPDIAKEHPDEDIVVIGTGHNAPLWPQKTPQRHATHVVR